MAKTSFQLENPTPLFYSFQFNIKLLARSNPKRPSVSVRIPMVLKTDRLAIQAAIKTCHIADDRDVRLVRIKNTLEAHRMEISENLFAEARANPKLESLSDAHEWNFQADGNLW